MNLGVISVRYARALIKSAIEEKQEERVYQELMTLADSYIHVPNLRWAIDNPMLDKAKKEELLITACGGSATEMTKSFIRLVLKEGRENMLQFMANAYATLYRQQKNIISGRLITATAVSPETEQRMKQMVENRTQATVEFQTELDSGIIGGFILEYDSYRMDASVRTKLNSILKQLKK